VVLQSFNLWPHMTALQNVMEGLISVRGLMRADAVEKASEALRAVGLSQKQDSYPAGLSGGQQHVGIARTIAMQAESSCSTSPPVRSILNLSVKSSP
jgi:ABC-type polar amino acid transport system ATPase subunit